MIQTSKEQFHIAYDATQDRLLLRVTGGPGGEFRVWLTRRYSELLLNVLINIMDKNGGMRGIASHPDTLNVLRGNAFTQHTGSSIPVDPEAAMPLGADGILGYRITYGATLSGNTSLQLLPEQGPGVNLDLDRTMVYLIYNLLEQGVAQADWRVRVEGQSKDPVH